MHPELLARSGEAAKSGPIGLAIILILCIACYFLFKSMSKHLKSVREDFPKDEAEPPDKTGAAPVTDAPVTDAPVTDAPVTDAPVTDAPAADAPAAEAAADPGQPTGKSPAE
jgi:hypothetical protein